MNFNLSDYAKILTGFSSSVFSIIISSLFVAFITLLIISLLLFLLRKIILVKRRHVILKIISISYFVIIPILGCILGFKWGLANGIESELKKNVAKYTQNLDTEFKKGLELGSALLPDLPAESGKTFSVNSLIDTLSDHVYEQYGKMLEKADLDKGDFSGKTAAILLRITKGKGVSYAIKNGIKTLVENNVGIDQSTTEKVMNVKFNELVNEGLFSKILIIQIDDFFGDIKKTIIITFCIILLLPVIEIFIANRLHQKDKQTIITIPIQ